MIIFCDECGERYVLEDDDMKENVVIFECEICHSVVKVNVTDHRVRKQPERGTPQD